MIILWHFNINKTISMYSVKIRDHIMIAHSLDNPVFGPAQSLHGATYVVDIAFYSPSIEPNNIVIDISLAADILSTVLEQLRYKNLDELPEFKGKLTTTEFLARYIHDAVKSKITDFFNGKIGVTLGESHIAWASYIDD
jgi:6-pyruvoyltetrahydropterin/6-carboxytetrahydropterin synthase